MSGDDQLLPLARWVFLPLVPLTAIFGPLLILVPGRTGTYWSWPISPPMSAVWVGAGYAYGAGAITTMLVLNRWRTSILAITATIPFSIAMLVATLVHLDRFSTGTVRFWVWFVIYLVLPIGLPVIYLRNRRRDPGVRPGDLLLPRWLGALAAVAGTAVNLVGLVLFFSPSTGARFWPWPLTPLMSQVIAGWLFFFGTGATMLAVERRFVAVRAFLPAVAGWFAVLAIAGAFRLEDFTTGPVATGAYFAGTVAVVVAAAALMLFLRMERAPQK